MAPERASVISRQVERPAWISRRPVCIIGKEASMAPKAVAITEASAGVGRAAARAFEIRLRERTN